MRKVFIFPVLVAGFLFPAVGLRSPSACAKEPAGAHRAAVVVKYDSETEDHVCIAFDGEGQTDGPEGISGVAALRKTGLVVVTKTDPTYGEQICKIGDVGGDDCASSEGYWAYFHADASGRWSSSDVGATAYRVVEGAVEGWAWASLSSTDPYASVPKPARFDEICSAIEKNAGKSTPRISEPSPYRWLILGGAVAALILGSIVARRMRSRS